MRLEDWQKYIESEFVETDESDPAPEIAGKKIESNGHQPGRQDTQIAGSAVDSAATGDAGESVADQTEPPTTAVSVAAEDAPRDNRDPGESLVPAAALDATSADTHHPAGSGIIAPGTPPAIGVLGELTGADSPPSQPQLVESPPVPATAEAPDKTVRDASARPAEPRRARAKRARPQPAAQAEAADVAPFAEYITAPSDAPPADPPSVMPAPPQITLVANAATTEPAGERIPAESPAEPLQTIADTAQDASHQPRINILDRYPLAASQQTLLQLRLVDAGQSTKEQQGARHRRAALLRRVCDPTLSLFDAALLLDAPVDTVLQLTQAGALPAIEPAGRRAQSTRRPQTDGVQPQFRLSDIVAFLATRSMAGAG